MTYSLNWDLDSIFPGGSSSEELITRMNKLKTDSKTYQTLVREWDIGNPKTNQLFKEILKLQSSINDGFMQCSSFINALLAANTNDSKAKILLGNLSKLMPAAQLGDTLLKTKLMKISDEQWSKFIEHNDWKELAFRLTELRTEGRAQLSENEENIINTLSLDGLAAWSAHYDTIVSTLTLPFTEKDGSVSQLSAGQAFNRMTSDPDAEIRQTLFDLWEAAWTEKSPLLADTLNHLDGFRLSDYQLHGIKNFLEKPLTYNRMKEDTLNAMWQVISENKQHMVDYLTRKAQLFGKEKMDWQDQDAPVILGNLKEKVFSFDEAAAFILTNFKKFSPKMAEFAQSVFEKSWIEAEDRPGKRPGGYCTELPETKESRIFMTYGGSINEVATLAHELGHAFHSSVLWELPTLNRDYAMNVAETASTFAELIVADASLKTAETNEERINLLDAKLQNANAMFMNIHARFLFETNFYEARKSGLLSEEQITEMMLEAQKESYQNCLDNYHPHFWASKLHFFIDDIPFYNFPYTFGYLFSQGIYATAQKSGTDFEDSYIDLLRDTASMTSEDLAEKHLNVDLTKPEFWKAGVDLVNADIKEFLELTEPYV
ncbi:M3 family oligoendopeptidase [Enterococcus sp. CWB-B31]|uniref:M3 family oligoendopeptidase n=1 Tax=Enterococcus sp. CWB-B31 TaxID=2885159 RepID=UPI001E5AD46D|nr:M3 family oligoendopeptidase [Enterococcus sp. CWB-B31]MCB5953645.1 M3 family oligoendopeptidase [Enterococcus sp. CWB-B31]